MAGWTPPSSDKVTWTPPSSDKVSSAQPQQTYTTQDLINQIPGAQTPAQTQTAPQEEAPWYRRAINAAAGLVEPAVSAATGAIAGPVGAAYGLGYGLTHNYGTQAGANEAERRGAALAQRMTYQPVTETGRAITGVMGNLLDRSGIAGLGPDAGLLARAGEGASAALPGVRAYAQPALSQAARAVKNEAGMIGGAIGAKLPETASAQFKNIGAQVQNLAKPATSAQSPEIQPPELPQHSTALVPAPQRQYITKDLPGVDESGNPLSPMTTHDQVMNLAGKQLQGIEKARSAAGDELNVAIAKSETGPIAPGNALYDQLDALKKNLVSMQGRAGAGASRNAIQSMIDDVSHAQTSDTPLDTLIQARKSWAKKAGYGEPSTGFDAIGEKNARNVINATNNVLDEHIAGYAGKREQYAQVLNQKEPYQTQLFKALGVDETSGQNVVDQILNDPKKLETASTAVGGIDKLDGVTSKHIVGTLKGKSAQQITDYVAEHKPVLDKLPQTQKVIKTMLDRTEMADTLDALKARIGKTQAAQQTAAQQRTETALGAQKRQEAAAAKALDYRMDLAALQRTPLTNQGPILERLVKRLTADGQITELDANNLLSQISKAEGSARYTNKLRTLSKYVLYAMTGKYLISFGGPALFDTLHK